MKDFRFALTVLSALLLTGTVRGQGGLVVTPTSNVGVLVEALIGDSQGILVVPGSEVLIGATGQQGTFFDAHGANGCRTADFNNGVILSSGTAADVTGPNQLPDTTTQLSLDGDECLDAALGAEVTFDANILSFRFTADPGLEHLELRFVFASEEYPEYVGSEFNDILAVFVDPVPGVDCGEVAAVVAVVAGLLPTRDPPGTSRVPPRSPATEAAAGLVVEDVDADSVLESAGILTGDEISSWKRPPRPTSLSEAAHGRLESYFDWQWMVREQAPRGTLELIGRRAGAPVTFTVPPGDWRARLRPAMPEKSLEIYRAGRRYLAAGDSRTAVRTWRRLAESATDWRLRCWILVRIAEAHLEADERELALAAYSSAREQAEDAAARGTILLAVGNLQEGSARPDEAEESYRAALESWRRAFGESISVAKVLQHLGRLESRRDRVDLAERYLTESLDVNRRLAPGSLDVASSLNVLGRVALTRNDFDRASELYGGALAIYRALAPRTRYETAGLNNLASVRFRRGDLLEASELYRLALEIHERAAPGSRSVATTLNNVGLVERDRGDLESAAEHHERALAIIEELAPGTRSEATYLVNLSQVYRLRGDPEGVFTRNCG